MTLTVRVTPLGRAALAAALLAAATVAAAQQPPSGAPSAAPAAKPSAKEPAATKEAPAAKSAAHSPSYSIGLLTGEQMARTGLSTETLNMSAFTEGVRAGLSGKVEASDADRTAFNKMMTDIGARNGAAAATYLAENAKKPGIVTTKSGLQYKVVKEGSGESPKSTDEVTVNYRGTLINGHEFDSSYARGEPISFPLNRVIPGWTEGVGLMKPGAKYMLYIPPELAYGTRPKPGIPPGSLLIFEVELLSAKAQAMPPAPAPGTPPPATPK
jgi:FKBP-type peptidyl-prolyl cis-trans isomerase